MRALACDAMEFIFLFAISIFILIATPIWIIPYAVYRFKSKGKLK